MNEVDRLKQDLQQAQLAYSMAAQLSQLKAGFLGRISHELRSPISSLMGLHQLILNDLCESREEEREFIRQSFEATHKLLKIIDEIITVSKIEYRKIDLKIISFQLAMVFDDLYQCTHLQAANRNLKLEVVFPEPELYVLADLEKFLQVLITLVDTGITLAQEGTIKVLSQVKPDSTLGLIYIDIPCPVHLWEEEIPSLPLISNPTFETVKTLSQQLEMSPSLKFSLAQSLIQTMQGHLEILPIPQPNQSQDFTQIQCLIPLGSVAQE